MSKDIGIVGYISLLCLFGAPLISGMMKGEQLTKSNSGNGIYRGQNIEVEVVDVNSTNGFKFCSFYIKTLEKKMIGPCNDTSNKTTFVVGATYVVSSMQISNGSNIVINKAEQISTGNRIKVVRLFNRANTRLAELDNGDVVGGANLNVGDFVYR